MIRAGAAEQWLRDCRGLIADAADAMDTAEIAANVNDSGGAWVVPAFQGLGTVFAASDTTTIVGGLSNETTRVHLGYAFFEAIAEQVADAAESICKASGVAQALRVDGGARPSDVLKNIQADMLSRCLAEPS